jgi:hypothetical protein
LEKIKTLFIFGSSLFLFAILQIAKHIAEKIRMPIIIDILVSGIFTFPISIISRSIMITLSPKEKIIFSKSEKSFFLDSMASNKK